MKTNSTAKLSVFISDSNEICLAGLTSFVNQYPGVHGISSANNPSEVRILFRNIFFDLFLIDIDMLGLNATNFIRIAISKNKSAKVILLSNIDDVSQIKTLLKAGACGYLNKKTSKNEIHKAIKVVLGGEYYLDAHLKKSALLELFGVEKEHCLTSYDEDILYLISHEFSNKEIAKYLGVTEKSIEYHRLDLFKSLGLKNMAGAGVYAVRNGIYFNPMLINKFAEVINKIKS